MNNVNLVVKCGVKGIFIAMTVHRNISTPYSVTARRLSIVERIRNGKTLYEVGKEEGVSRQRIAQILQEAGFNGVSDLREPWPSTRLKSCSVCEESYQKGTYRQHLAQVKHKRSIPSKKYEDEAIIEEYFDQKLTLMEISEKFNMSHYTNIYRILKRNNLKPNGRYVKKNR